MVVTPSPGRAMAQVCPFKPAFERRTGGGAIAYLGSLGLSLFDKFPLQGKGAYLGYCLFRRVSGSIDAQRYAFWAGHCAEMVTALLVDDHPLFQDGFAAMLRHHRPDWTLRSASSGAEAAALLAGGERPDLAIIDIQLPDTDGFDAARVIAQMAPMVSRVMISGREDGAARRRSRDCGASGFISKAWAPERIIEMLEQVLAGGVAFETSVAAGAAQAITARQLEVLTLLADGHSNKAIERHMNIAPRTVRAHLTEIFHLLEADGRVQAILKARQLGLIG
jgi:DNA-binding NarL/FixJ family response regulator